jgi:hypothetical protein
MVDMEPSDTTPDGPVRTSWATFAEEVPELATAVRARFEWTKHHVLASLRADGSPRVSGTEVVSRGDDLFLGSMWHAVKARDLQRDGRFAIHSNPGSPEMVGGDAKLSGVAVEVVGDARDEFEEDVQPPTPFQLFRLEFESVVHTTLHPDGDRIVVTLWRPGQGITVTERV